MDLLLVSSEGTVGLWMCYNHCCGSQQQQQLSTMLAKLAWQLPHTIRAPTAY
jgi:hypothetical protein